MCEWRREKYRASGFRCGHFIHLFGQEFFGRAHLHVAIRPLHFGADAFQYLDKPVYLFNFGHMLNGRRSAIEERSSKERHRGVLRDVRRNRTGKLSAANDFVVHVLIIRWCERKESDLRPLSYQDSVLPLNYARVSRDGSKNK